MNKIFEECMTYLIKYRRIAAAGVVAVSLVAMIGVAKSTDLNPMAGAYGAYNDQTQNEELTDLLNTYYKAYDNNDVETLKKVATPFSDRELSYIAMVSEYIDAHTIESLFTKAGSEKDSLLVSVKVKIKYNSLETPAPGLDFFYLEKDDKGYHINNAYSLFNLQNGELEVDPAIVSLIAVFESQDDVINLQKEVQAEHEKLMLSDPDYNAFFTTSLRDAISGWASNYETELAEKKAAEEAAAAEAAEKKKAAAAAAEEEANKKMVRVTAKVNVRESASKSASSLGQVAKGTELAKLGEEGDWSKVEYDGEKAYIMTEYLEEVKAEEEEAAENANEEEGENENAETAEAEEEEKPEDAGEETAEDEDEGTAAGEGTAANFKKGDTVKMSDAVNVRMERDESSKIAAVAYAGLEVKIIKIYDDGWTEVGIDGKTGYMKTDLIK